MSQRITPFLWFDSNAEEAANFYVSVFPNSEITEFSRYGEAGPRAAGSVMVVSFRLDGQEFTALNGGPEFTFNEAVSFLIDCNTGGGRLLLGQAHRWGRAGSVRLAEGQVRRLLAGQPDRPDEMLQDEDRERADRVMQAMLQMGKIDIAKLEEAYAQA